MFLIPEEVKDTFFYLSQRTVSVILCYASDVKYNCKIQFDLISK